MFTFLIILFLGCAHVQFVMAVDLDGPQSLDNFKRQTQEQEPGRYFKTYTLKSGYRYVQVYIMERVHQRDAQKLVDWIRYGAGTLTRLYGELPLARIPVYVYPIGPDDSVVPWGEVKRNDLTTVHLYVDHTRSLQEMIEDWTLLHELCHTLHPYLLLSGRWLTEGLATYYQNILQARAGTLTHNQAWTKLHQGFNRGRAETEKGQSLAMISSRMRDNHKYMRVYWSGVALWLRADWMLRTRYKSSLDTVMQKFMTCCLVPERSWSNTDFMQRLDALSGTKLFTSLYHRYADSDTFPELGDVYLALGIQAQSDTVSFNKNAPHYYLITDIMRNKNKSVH